MRKCPQLSHKKKNEIWQQVLKQQQQKQSQAREVEEVHLHIQIDDSKTDAAADAQDPLDQTGEYDFGLLQKESSNPKVAESRATIDPKNIYLNTCLSFHYMFIVEHLNDVRNVSSLIRGHCNSDLSHAD